MYRTLVAGLGKESAAVWYDSPDDGVPGVAVFIWRAVDATSCTLATVGMAKRCIPAQDFAAELVMRVNGALTDGEEELVARFLANLSQCPFHDRLSIDWNHLVWTRTVPLFPSCDGVIFWAFPIDGSNHFHDDEGVVRFLTVVPVSAAEREIARARGSAGLEQFWEERNVDPAVRR